MPEHPLNIIPARTDQDPSTDVRFPTNSRTARTKELQAKFERLWLTDPERFNPLRNCMERLRLERTWGLLTKHVDLVNKQTADIGCAAGVFSRRLRDQGARVEAVDIAENALKVFKQQGNDRILLRRDAMPETSMPNHHFDLIICTELIAELSKEDYRLFFAELSRLIKSDGHLICSSPIDIDTEGGVEKLIELVRTEFDIMEDAKSYHSLYIRMKRFLDAPSQFIEGWKNRTLKKKELSTRRGFNKWWYGVNTSPFAVWLWFICEPCTRPFLRFLKSSPRFLLFLESACRFISAQEGVSHYLFIAKRRPFKSVEQQDMPIQKLGRKEVWE